MKRRTYIRRPAEGEQALGMISSKKIGSTMKHIASVALTVNLGVAGVYAQQGRVTVMPVTMTFSGNGAPSPINLNYAKTQTVEENVAGNGALGPFTFRDVRAASNSSQTVPPSTCPSSDVFYPSVAGGGILRFQDGSLLNVSLKQGGDCIDFVHLVARCTLTLQITGGTGRF
jgi:hypothetical protein